MVGFLEPDLFKTSSGGSAAGGCGSASSASGGCAAVAGGCAAVAAVAAVASSPSCHACLCPSSSLTSWHHHASLTCRSFILRTTK